MKTYVSTVVVLTIVLLGQFYGIEKGYYVSITTYDIVMHILGGLGIGLFIHALYNSGAFDSSNIKRTIIYGVLIVGIVWEIFEIIFNLNGYTFGTKAYYLDTFKDLADDMIGGALVAWAARNRQ